MGGSKAEQQPNLRRKFTVGMAALASSVFPSFELEAQEAKPATTTQVDRQNIFNSDTRDIQNNIGPGSRGTRQIPISDAVDSISYSYTNPESDESFNFKVDVHRGLGPGNQRRQPYFVTPAPALIQASQTIDGYPSIVHKINRQKDSFGRKTLHFKAHLLNDALKAEAKARVLALENKYLSGLGDPQPKVVDIQKWPVEGVIITCRLKEGSKTELARTYENDLGTEVNDFGFQLSFLPADEQKFLDAVEDGTLEFSFLFYYSGSWQGIVRQQVTTSNKLNSQIESYLQAQGWMKADGTIERAITIPESIQLRNHVRDLVRTSVNITATNGDYLGELFRLYDSTTEEIMAQLLGTETLRGDRMVQFAQQNPEAFRRALSAHLEPVKIKSTEGQTQTDIDITFDIDEKTQVNTSGKNIGFTLAPKAMISGVPVSGFALNNDNAKRVQAINRHLRGTQNQSGIVLESNSQVNRYVPEAITVEVFNSVNGTVSIALNSEKTLSIQKSGRLSPISVSANMHAKMFSRASQDGTGRTFNQRKLEQYQQELQAIKKLQGELKHSWEKELLPLSKEVTAYAKNCDAILYIVNQLADQHQQSLSPKQRASLRQLLSTNNIQLNGGFLDKLPEIRQPAFIPLRNLEPEFDRLIGEGSIVSALKLAEAQAKVLSDSLKALQKTHSEYLALLKSQRQASQTLDAIADSIRVNTLGDKLDRLNRELAALHVSHRNLEILEWEREFADFLLERDLPPTPPVPPGNMYPENLYFHDAWITAITGYSTGGGFDKRESHVHLPHLNEDGKLEQLWRLDNFFATHFDSERHQSIKYWKNSYQQQFKNFGQGRDNPDKNDLTSYFSGYWLPAYKAYVSKAGPRPTPISELPNARK